jgi:cell division protein ZipA
VTELRWILLAAGVVLLLALWIRERRRSRAGSVPDPFALPPERVEPVLDGDPIVDEQVELPAVTVGPADRIGVAGDWPVIEIPADARPELAQPARVAVPVIAPAAQPAPARAAEPPPRRPAAGREAADPGVARQRIVALRVMSAGDRWPGAQLREVLHAEGLTFGKYSIFHRQRDDGRTIFSVASMVEPGSFDLEGIDDASFPGVSVFAVLPGPLDAPSTFDQMLACARRMSDRLGGNLQDEHGSSLTGQRVLNLREELVHFEHLLARLRARQT